MVAPIKSACVTNNQVGNLASRPDEGDVVNGARQRHRSLHDTSAHDMSEDDSRNETCSLAQVHGYPGE